MKGTEILQVGEHVLVCLVGFHILRLLRRNGPMGVAAEITKWIRAIPGVDSALAVILAHEAKGAVRLLTANNKDNKDDKDQNNKNHNQKKKKQILSIPLEGLSVDDIIKQLEAKQIGEKQMLAEGRVFAFVYTPNDEKHSLLLNAAHGLFSALPPHPQGGAESSQQQHHEAFLRSVYSQFAHGNALNPTAFPSLLEMENDVVAMTAAMLNGDTDVAGSMTSGGTESILMAMKTYRDRARALAPHIKHPEVIAPITIHPAFEKAAHYFDLTIVHVPIDQDLKPDLAKYKAAINRNTILLLASAPQYCHGVVDPIEAISDLALAHGLPLHVDACFGGFMLPWVEKLGFPVPRFDFRVPGVTSISADLHKVDRSLLLSFSLSFFFSASLINLWNLVVWVREQRLKRHSLPQRGDPQIPVFRLLLLAWGPLWISLDGWDSARRKYCHGLEQFDGPRAKWVHENCKGAH